MKGRGAKVLEDEGEGKRRREARRPVITGSLAVRSWAAQSDSKLLKNKTKSRTYQIITPIPYPLLLYFSFSLSLSLSLSFLLLSFFPFGFARVGDQRRYKRFAELRESPKQTSTPTLMRF